ncbi:MAG: hypothetical protein WC554_09865 [Clostridia bacterium]|jgi:hypothetical protein
MPNSVYRRKKLAEQGGREYKRRSFCGEWTPKQQLFFKCYLDPKSDTFSDIRKSAIKAGYSDYYATTFGNKDYDLDWLREGKLRLSRMLNKAERNIEGFLDKFDDVKADQKLVLDASKFVAKTVGRDVYGEKVEVEHKGKIETIQVDF